MKWRLWFLMMGLLAVGAIGCTEKAGPATREAGVTTRAAEPAKPTTMYATKAARRKLVYIVDRSAAVADTFEALKGELVRSVKSMLPVYEFDVVMLGETSEAVFPEMQRATPDIKKEFAGKLETMKAQGMIEGKLAPYQEAFEQAFAVKPEIIFFLTASAFDPELLKAVDGLNKNHKVRVNTIAYGREDEKFQAQLRELAKRNGGVYKLVTKDEARGKE